MALKKVCGLAYDKAVEAIKGTEEVYYNYGVWNPFRLAKTEDAIRSIRDSDYGADVYQDDESGMYYVSIPGTADMW